MADTRIGEDAEGGWVLLKPDSTPAAFRMPRNGFYFDDCSFDEAGGIDPRKFTPVTDLPDEQLDRFAHHARHLRDTCFAWGVAADDSGTQRGEFIAPDLWAEMIKPHYKKLCDWVHQHTKMKTFFHSCGSVYNLSPHFIDAGIDILNPVQISAVLMEPARLKREF